MGQRQPQISGLPGFRDPQISGLPYQPPKPEISGLPVQPNPQPQISGLPGFRDYQPPQPGGLVYDPAISANPFDPTQFPGSSSPSNPPISGLPWTGPPKQQGYNGIDGLPYMPGGYGKGFR